MSRSRRKTRPSPTTAATAVEAGPLSAAVPDDPQRLEHLDGLGYRVYDGYPVQLEAFQHHLVLGQVRHVGYHRLVVAFYHLPQPRAHERGHHRRVRERQ